MGIEDAIQHCWEKAAERTCPDLCKEDHAQLALWLEELCKLRKEVAELRVILIA